MEREAQQKREPISKPVRQFITVLNTLPFLTYEEKEATLAYYCWSKDPTVAQKGLTSLGFSPEFVEQSIEKVTTSEKIEEVFSGIDRMSENSNLFKGYMSQYRRLAKDLNRQNSQATGVERVKSLTNYERFSDKIAELRLGGVSREKMSEILNVSIHTVDGVISKLLREGVINPGRKAKTVKQKPERPKSKVEVREDLIKRLYDEAIITGTTLPSNQEIKNEIKNQLGKDVSILTISRSIFRLIRRKEIPPRRTFPNVAEFDTVVKEKYLQGLTLRQIAVTIDSQETRVRGSVSRLQALKQIPIRQGEEEGVRGSVAKYLEDFMVNRPGMRVNLSTIAREHGVSRERVRQLYNALKIKQELPPKGDKKVDVKNKILAFQQLYPGVPINLVEVAKETGVTGTYARSIYYFMAENEGIILPPILTSKQRRESKDSL